MPPKKGLKAALGNSLHAEESAVENRFAKADSYFGSKEVNSEKVSDVSLQNKVIRDGFTMPTEDYDLIAKLRNRGLEAGYDSNKSEVLRAGLHALTSMSTTELIQVLQTLSKVKTGRPTKE